MGINPYKFLSTFHHMWYSKNQCKNHYNYHKPYYSLSYILCRHLCRLLYIDHYKQYHNYFHMLQCRSLYMFLRMNILHILSLLCGLFEQTRAFDQLQANLSRAKISWLLV